MRAVETHWALYGKPPSYRQLLKLTQTKSINGLQIHIRKLIEDGYLTKVGQTTKSQLKLTKKLYFE